jgi:hypothetical protein
MQMNQESRFKLKLFIGDELDLVYEREFDGGCYYPLAKNEINIKSLLPSMLKSLESLLKTDSEYLNFMCNGYDLLKEYKNVLKTVGGNFKSKIDKPKNTIAKIKDFTVSGVKFNLSFFINENLIVERTLYLNEYNPSVRFSADLGELMDGFIYEIKTYIKNIDMSYQWQDYEIYERNFNNFEFLSDIEKISKDYRSKLLTSYTLN